MKILKILFLILIIFSIAEAGYYMYLQSQSHSIKYVPMPTPMAVPTLNISPSVPTPSYNFSILNSIRNGYTSKATVVKKYTGTLIRLNQNGTYPSGYKYLYSFQLTTQKGEINLGYSAEDWQNATIFKRVNNKDVQANIEAFVPDSKIEITETWQLMQESDTLESVSFILL
jgi:hypothetical protein